MPVDTSGVSAGSLFMPDAKQKTTSAKETAALDKNAFLKLLAAQAKSQDPMNPTDSTAQIAQLAQFSSLEQMSNVATEMKTLRTSVDTQRATALVGHEVTYKDAQGADVTGVVTKVRITTEDGPLLTVGAIDGIKPSVLTEVR
ncbi:MAG: flagellar hook capping FlgD N-terminal domain-containing protein [Solirubrobacteraceae bacterium]|nr:flagellar hook capping FlgD N-terminal domain-containing protein [Solirubrobacteraceae bacterium]